MFEENANLQPSPFKPTQYHNSLSLIKKAAALQQQNQNLKPKKFCSFTQRYANSNRYLGDYKKDWINPNHIDEIKEAMEVDEMKKKL